MKILWSIILILNIMLLFSVWNALVKALYFKLKCVKLPTTFFDFLLSVSKNFIIILKVFIVGILKILITLATMYTLLMILAPIIILVLFEVFYIQTLVFINIPNESGFFYLVFWYGWGIFILLLLLYFSSITILLLKYSPFWIWDQNFFDSYKRYIYFIYFFLFCLLLYQYGFPYWGWYLFVRKVMFAYIEVLKDLEFFISLLFFWVIFIYWFIILKYCKYINYPFEKYGPYHYHNPWENDCTFFSEGGFLVKPSEDVIVEFKQDENGLWYCFFEETYINTNDGGEEIFQYLFEVDESIAVDSNISHLELYELIYLKNKDFGASNPEISDAELCYIISDVTLWDLMERVDRCNLGDPDRSKKIMEAIYHQKCSFFFFPKGCPRYFTPFHKIKVYFWFYYGLIIGFKE